MRGAPTCPKCGALLDGATYVGEEQRIPNPGDLSVCIYCGTVTQFAENADGELILEELSAEEFSNLPIEVQNKMIVFRQMILAHRN